ncbi:MAG: recombinase family protein [Patescibacteria group bacterium]
MGNDNQGLILAAIYCRVSSERQEQEGTIQSQIDALEKVIQSNGDTLVSRYIDDGYSGELLWERPELDRLRNEAPKAEWKKLYVLDPDRLARKHLYAGIIIEELKKYGKEVVFLNRPLGNSVEDQLLFNIQSVFADYEKHKLLDRMMRGKIFKAKNGTLIGNTPPFGYNYVKDEKARIGRYEINPEEADTVKIIYELYATGDYSIFKIAQELNRRNAKSKKWAVKWPTSSLGRILGNETYCGITYWGKSKSVETQGKGKYRRLKNEGRIRRPKDEWHPISVPPIINRELFEKVQAVKASSKRLSHRTKHEYLLKGLIKCSVCHTLYYCTSTVGRYYYYCGSKKKNYPYHSDIECRNRRFIPVEKFDDALWDAFCKVLKSPTVLQGIINRHQEKQRGRDSLEQEIEKIDQRVAAVEVKKSRLLTAYTEQAITLAEYRNQRTELERAKNELLVEKAGREAIKVPLTLQNTNIEQLARNVEGITGNMPFEKKLRIARLFFGDITCDGDTANVTAYVPRFLLETTPNAIERIERELVSTSQPSQQKVSYF